MPKNPDLSIIIVNFNTTSYVLKCLESIFDHLLGIRYEIIVVDNSSDENEKETLKRAIPGYRPITIIDADNRGFGAANNLGVKQASGQYLLLLNPDTIVPKDPGFDKLIDFMRRNNKIGIVSPLLYNDMDMEKLQINFFSRFQNFLTLIVRKQSRSEKLLSKESFPVDMVVFASAFMKRELFENLHGFDENIFMFFEDDDICLRTKQLGFETCVFTGAKMIHLQGKSISKNYKRRILYYKSQTYYWQKHHGKFSTVIMRIIRFPYKLIRTHF